MKKIYMLLLFLILCIAYLVYEKTNKENAINFCIKTINEQEIIDCTESPFVNWMNTTEYFHFLMLHKDFQFKNKNYKNLFFMQLSFAYGNCNGQEVCKKESADLLKQYEQTNIK